MSLKVWIAPALAALALGVISCTQPNQTAHSAGAQYVNTNTVKTYPQYAETEYGTKIYRIIDCETKSVIYSSGNGLSATPMRDSRVIEQFCGG